MKIKEGYILREVAGNCIVVPVGNLDFNGVITLNETGKFIWRLLEKETSAEEIAAALQAEYEIDKDTAANDTARFLQKLKDAALLV